MEIEFYHSASGTYYVKEFIMEQQPKAVKAIYRELERIGKYQLSVLTRAGIIKKLHGYDIWEVMVDSGKVCYRIFCAIRKTVCHLLHGFIKKSNKTHLKEIKTTLNRIKDLDYQLSLATN